MHPPVIFPLALLGSVVALRQTTTLFLPGFYRQPLVASIAGSDETATTYAIQCDLGALCGAGPGFTLIEGPKTAHFELIYGDASIFSSSENCVFTSTSTALCTEMATGSLANSPGTTIGTYAFDVFDLAMVVVTVTAGEVSTAPASTAAKATAPTATVTTATTVGTASAGSSFSVSTGGLPRITGNVEWAVGGAAAVMALAGL